LPNPLTAQELPRLGIPESLANRTLRALSFLGLLDEEGHRTATFERLGKASSNEYPELLSEIIKEAYKDVFTIIDPAEATDIEINDAFRHYEPHAQRSRMIVLFRGLCQEAGLVSGEPPQSLKRPRTPTSKPVSQSNGAKKPQPKSEFASHAEPYQVPIQPIIQPMSNQEFALLQGVISKLPMEKKWTQRQRDKWLQAFTANVDLLIDVVESDNDLPYRE
jgi:Family of unknown function (DUF5343)